MYTAKVRTAPIQARPQTHCGWFGLLMRTLKTVRMILLHVEEVFIFQFVAFM